MDLYAHAKSVIESQVCEIHKERPVINFYNNKFGIECCCSDFKIICFKLALKLLLEQKNKKMSVAWRKPED